MRLLNNRLVYLKNFALILLAISLLILTNCTTENTQIEDVEQWSVFQLTIKTSPSENHYMETELSAVFSNGEDSIKVPGFYDGSGEFKIRFSPNKQGEWSYLTESNVGELSSKEGKFNCVAPTGTNHGPVKPFNTFYLNYADGTTFYSVGTTAYQWTSVKQNIQEKTIETLKNAPFNKIRMCVFPKSYRYGNDTEPWMLPFKIQDDENVLDEPNYEFFQNFDKRVEQLMNMGIQADVILFHPYDKWGYSKMGKEMNEKYVRYMIARISAYRNVWWSMANEWDVPRIKDEIDWDGIGSMLQKEDPHQRLRGIHNWYHDESHFYDHSRPWITHVSAQTYLFFNAIKWRNKYQKPILFDEMRYEGDVPSGWGNLTAKEMTDYFWKAGLSGVYGTHGDTFNNDSDVETEVRWWAKGGTLPGKSPERITFFKNIMEEAPVTEMIPKIVSLSGLTVPENIPDKYDPKFVDKLNNNIYTFFKEGEYYLTYTAEPGQTIELNLSGSKKYSLEVIDTWNMKIVAAEGVHPGNFKYETKMPYSALRLISE
ncbi:MAG: DUF5060 domain-containing protein [Melioribacteraceae bacterium]|nr:DUF5060 domain-containing protein [Melioribacteraceae bacterium]